MATGQYHTAKIFTSVSNSLCSRLAKDVTLLTNLHLYCGVLYSAAVCGKMMPCSHRNSMGHVSLTTKVNVGNIFQEIIVHIPDLLRD